MKALSPLRVLVVDDEENVSFLISTALKLAGYQTRTVATGADAVGDAARFAPHLVILDVGLPDMDGFEVLRRIRVGGSSVPVLFVTARQSTTDRVRGLTSGGDDYIVKPFELEELLARVQAVLRRSGKLTESSRLQVADLIMDLDSHRVWRGDAEVALSATEFNLLRVLLGNAGRVVTRDQILDAVWHYDFNGETTIIESFVSNLRKKVDFPDPKLIHTVRGVGYSIREP